MFIKSKREDLMRYVVFFFLLLSIVLRIRIDLFADTPSECTLEQGSLCISSSGVGSLKKWSFPSDYNKLIFIGGDSKNIIKYTYKNSKLSFKPDSIFWIKNNVNLTFKASSIFKSSPNDTLLLENNMSSGDANINLTIENSISVNFGTITTNNKTDDKAVNFLLHIKNTPVNIDHIDFFGASKGAKIIIRNKEIGDTINTLSVLGKVLPGYTNKVALFGNFQEFDASNAKISLSGDVIGSIQLKLLGSEFIFKDDNIAYQFGGASANSTNEPGQFNTNDGGLQYTLNLSSSSVFKMSKGELVFNLLSSSIKGNSKFIADNIYVKSTIASFGLTLGSSYTNTGNDHSSFFANNFTFNSTTNIMTLINIEINDKSSFTIADKLDLSKVKWGHSSDEIDKVFFQAKVAKGATFYVNELIMGPENYVQHGSSSKSYGSYFKFPNSKVEFKKITFKQNNYFRIINPKNLNSVVKVDTIDFTANTDPTKGAGNSTGDVFIDFQSNTLELKNRFDINNVNITNIFLKDSTIQGGSLSSIGKGFIIEGDKFSSFKVNNLTTTERNCSSGKTIINGIQNFIVRNNLTTYGELILDKKSIVELHNWSGAAASIHLKGDSQLKLNKNTIVKLKEGIIPINIERGSILEISGNKVFDPDVNQNNIKAINAGMLNISGLENHFDEIQNKGGTLRIKFNDTFLDENKVVIKTVINTNVPNQRGSVELYDKAYVKEMTNEGDLNIFGRVKIDTLRQQEQNSSKQGYLIFHITKPDNTITLTLKDGPSFNKRIKVDLEDTSILHPSQNNRYDLLKTKYSAVNIEDLHNQELFIHTPGWLKITKGIDQKDKEYTVWINIERLTNFEQLWNYSATDNQEAKLIAKQLDQLVTEEKSIESIKQLINALDFSSNSKLCTIPDKDKLSEYIYQAANGFTEDDKQMAIKVLRDSNCLHELYDKFEQLAPINNLLFTSVLHNESSKVLSMLSHETKIYNGIGDYYIWVNNNSSYNRLSNNMNISGYKGFSNLLEIGMTGNFKKNVNGSGSLGFSLGNVQSNNHRYASNIFAINLAGAIAYISSSYYTTLSASYLLGVFNNNRYIDFIESTNNKVARSNSYVHSLAVKVDIGTDYEVNKALILNPNGFMLLTTMLGSNFQEKDSFAGYSYKNFVGCIPEIGVNIDATYEKLMESFVGINNVFFKTDISLGVSSLYMPSTKTQFNFLGIKKAISSLETIASSGFSMGFNGGVTASFYTGNHEINAYANLKLGTKFYNSYSFGLVYKYLF